MSPQNKQLRDATFRIVAEGRQYKAVWPADPDERSGRALWAVLIFTAKGEFVGYPDPPEGGFVASDQVFAAVRAYLTDPAGTRSSLEARRYVGLMGGRPYRDDIALARHEGRCSGLREAINALHGLLEGEAEVCDE
jgi:hypothetical protein